MRIGRRSIGDGIEIEEAGERGVSTETASLELVKSDTVLWGCGPL